MTFHLEDNWKNALAEEFEKPYFIELTNLVSRAYATSVVFPEAKNIYSAFNHCAQSSVAVVILGQDPYHGEGQAHGLSFSVPAGTPIPPSLKNIYKEILSDTGVLSVTSGDLTPWAAQGVLLLNSTLTVEAGQASSHQTYGWETFTDTVIKTISHERECVVFMLWGAFAQSKRRFVDETKHLVLTAPHPSPLSAYRGFLGCKHFSLCNAYLTAHNHPAINW